MERQCCLHRLRRPRNKSINRRLPSRFRRHYTSFVASNRCLLACPNALLTPVWFGEEAPGHECSEESRCGISGASLRAGSFSQRWLLWVPPQRPSRTSSRSRESSPSPRSSGNPAQNNPALNSILSGDIYKVILDFKGSIHSPGTYRNFQPPDPCFLSVAGAACFIDASAGASETSFGAISLTITADLDGIHDDLSLLACLNTGGGCVFGNQLDASFQILAADLNSHNAPATGLDQPHPLDFLEDDGVTDIQGTVNAYSYTSGVPGPAAVPEPSTWPY